MRTIRTTPLFLGLLMLVAAVASIAPQAAAQTPADQQASVQIVDVRAPDGDLQPLVDIKEVTGKIRINYVSTGCSNLGVIEVKLSIAKQPSWAQVSLQPASIQFKPKDASGCGTTQISDEQPFKAFVFATADAPAFQSEALDFKADLVNFNGNKGTSTTGGTFIKAGFYSILEARVDNPIQIARPQETVQIPIIITNFGNAPTKINFKVESTNPEKLVPSQITPVTIESRVSGKSNQQTVVLNAITPYHNGYLNEVGSINVALEGVYAQDTSKLSLIHI